MKQFYTRAWSGGLEPRNVGEVSNLADVNRYFRVAARDLFLKSGCGAGGVCKAVTNHMNTIKRCCMRAK
jgi:hypothetical protein